MAKVVPNGLFIAFSGRADNAVFIQRADGRTFVRCYTTPDDPRTPAQRRVRDDLRRAARAFRDLTPDQHAAWRRYAAGLARPDGPNGRPTTPRPDNLFTTLARKFWQVRPDDAPPALPPSAPFFGDGIAVTAAGGPGAVTFTANFPNTPGVVTELLLQPLSSAARKPEPRAYRPRAFHAFAPGDLSHPVGVAPGAWAAAYRFVHAGTGQSSPLVPLDTLRVV